MQREARSQRLLARLSSEVIRLSTQSYERTADHHLDTADNPLAPDALLGGASRSALLQHPEDAR